MSGGKKDSPKPPDYTGAAEKQGQSSIDAINAQTQANRPNQTTPFGSSTWSTGSAVDPTTGKPYTSWNQNISLTPEMQASLDAQNRITAGRSGIAEGLLGRAGDELSQPTDWSKFTPMGMGPSSGADARNSAEQALYSRATSRLDPQWQQTTGNMDIQLRNQGLKPGDEAYDRAMQNTNMAKNDAYEAARTGAITGGGAEASRQQQMDLSSSNYQNMARQQQIAESLQKQGWSLNAINAAISGQQVGMPNMPNFAGAGSAQPTQYLPAAGMQYGGQMDQNNASQMNLGGMMSGAGSLFNGLGSLFGWGG